jgi:hypothetical protein
MYYPRNGRGDDEYFGEAAEQQSVAPSVFLGQDQRRGHQNRERTTAPSVLDGLRGRFDPDTQTHNLVVPLLSDRASTVASESVSRDLRRGTYAPPPAPRSVAPPPPAPRAVARAAAGVAVPTRQSQLPTTRQGFETLANAINASGGINGSKIRVYAGSSVANIRKNFIKRLGLAGKA